jgi:hypothetical protein
VVQAISNFFGFSAMSSKESRRRRWGLPLDCDTKPIFTTSLGKQALLRFFGQILFSNGPNEARLGHFIFQMS